MPSAEPARLTWLDALRAIGATTVLAYHVPLYLTPALRGGWLDVMDWGHYGVLVFFLVSGYVIAMSYDRYADAGRFWIGRAFRLYPVFFLTAAGMVLVVAAIGRPFKTWTVGDGVTAVLSHLSMLTEFTTGRHVVGVFWTLSFEMVFYLMFTGLFVFGLHRYAHWWALGLAGVSLAAGPLLPNALLGGHLRLVAAALLILVALTIVGHVRRWRRTVLVCAAAGMALPLLLAVHGEPWNGAQAFGSWQALTYLAVMFCGAVIFLGHTGQLSVAATLLSLGAALALILAAHWRNLPLHFTAGQAPGESRHAYVTLAAVAGTFAVAFTLRRLPVPRVVSWLGRISYSTYMLHMVLLYALRGLFPQLRQLSFAWQAVVALAYVAVVLVASHLSYRAIERPGQRWGRTVGARVAVPADQPVAARPVADQPIAVPAPPVDVPQQWQPKHRASETAAN